MASVFKKTRDRKRPGACWYIAYTDRWGKRRTLKGCPDKAATEAVARKIESEMTYPGQIKVTVIRETRASDVAR